MSHETNIGSQEEHYYSIVSLTLVRKRGKNTITRVIRVDVERDSQYHVPKRNS